MFENQRKTCMNHPSVSLKKRYLCARARERDRDLYPLIYYEESRVWTRAQVRETREVVVEIDKERIEQEQEAIASRSRRFRSAKEQTQRKTEEEKGPAF